MLRDNGTLIAGDIAANFTDSSRPGISRHLRVLRECGLVTSSREGKARIYTLNPKPLNDLSEGWLSTFAQMQVGSLAALRQRVESDKPRRR